MADNSFSYKFTNSSLDSNHKLIRTVDQLGVNYESIFQIYDGDGVLFDNSSFWNSDGIVSKWENNTLEIDFSAVYPIKGTWELKFDRSNASMATGGYAPRETSENVEAEANELIICLSGGIEVKLPNATNGTMIKVSTQGIDSDVTVVPQEGSTILGSHNFVIGYSYSSSEFVYNSDLKMWRVVTPQITKIGGQGKQGGYNVVHIESDYTANSGDFIICDSPGLEVKLPSNQKNNSMIKISTQGIGGARIEAEDDAKIGDGFIYYMNPSCVIELVYDEQKNKWMVVNIEGDSSNINTIDDSEDECLAHKTNIKTREAFKDWIYRKLGWPLVSIELTDEMLDDCINDAILELSEYAYQNRKFYAFNLEDYKKDVGIELPIGVTIVTRVSSNLVGPNAVGAGKIDNYMNDLIANGAIGFPILGRPAGSGWVNYELAMSYLEFSQKMLGGDYDMSYDPRTRILQLWPDPIRTNQTKGWIVVECQCLRPDDQQFGENWVKQMALAQAKVVLGRVRSKFNNISLPGGGTVNTEDKSEGLGEIEALRTNLLERFPIANVFMY